MDTRAGEQQARLEAVIAQESHRNAAHLDQHLSQQINAGMARLAEQLHRAVGEEAHRNAAHLDQHLSQQLDARMDQLPEVLHKQVSHVDRHLSLHLTKELSLHLGSGPREGTPHGDQKLIQERLLTLARLLTPASALGIAKLRIGHQADGGYVMLDDLGRVRIALSLGVGEEMTWDVDVADRGIEVHQFDHTIEAPPDKNERIRFHSSRIAAVADGSDHSFSSAQALGGNQLCIIKMDIEGDEWEVLDAVAEGDFDRVPQLVCEFHDFDRVGDTAWFERADRVLRLLERTFRVVHVHANNNGSFQTRGNIAFPEILEVTFANRSFYEFQPSSEVFPTPLDAPNRGDLPDIVLGAFRF